MKKARLRRREDESILINLKNMKTKHMLRGINIYRIKLCCVFFPKKNKRIIKAKAGYNYILGKAGT